LNYNDSFVQVLDALAIFLLAESGDALMNLSLAAGNLIQLNHLTRDESMSNPKK
jgi:hypothetical protein